MVITDKFVFIHEAKTGGTFVTEALLKIRGSKFLPPKHATCRDIYKEHQNKTIVSIVRNPYDRYISSYYYRWWAKFPEKMFCNLDCVREKYPKFPEVSFVEFILIANKYRRKLRKHDIPISNLGFWSDNFVRYFFKKPEKIYSKIDDLYIKNKDYHEDMFKVHFLKTENLNNDLYNFLIGQEYLKNDIKFILELPNIRPQGQGKQRPDNNWEKYYTKELKQLIFQREKLIFTIFPEYK